MPREEQLKPGDAGYCASKIMSGGEVLQKRGSIFENCGSNMKMISR
jgi:hypothetical protein